MKKKEQEAQSFYTNPKNQPDDEATYRQILMNQSRDGIVILDQNGHVYESNKKFADMLGYPHKAMRQLSVFDWEVVYPRESLIEMLRNVDEKGDYFESKHRRKDGTIYDVEISTNAALFKDQKLIFCICRDITDRKKAEEEIKNTKDTYQNIFNSVSEAIYIQDHDGTFIDVNCGAVKMYGYSREELIGKTPAEVAAPGLNSIKAVSNYIKEVLKTGVSKTLEFWAIRKNGEVFPKEVILNKGYYFGKECLLTTARDITEHKKAQKELIEAKQKAENSDRLKSTFLSNMSHEIRTPLNAILGFTDLLSEQNLSYETRLEYIKIIQKSGKHLLKTVNDIIDISKIESGLMNVDMESVNVNEQIKDIYNLLKPEADEKGITLSYNNGLPPKNAFIKTDSKLLYTILTNLVKNAIKFTKVGKVEFGYEVVDTKLQFFIMDTGIGIPENMKELVFKDFVQADITNKKAYQGAGLGLSISKAYAGMLGGNISLESIEGKGSTFYFTMPYESETIAIHTVEDDLHKENKEIKNKEITLKILIVEDDISSEKYLSKVLSYYSRETLTARDGLEALDICQNNPDIDLILMDIQMPEMNGYEATLQIRQFNKDVTIIAQTAFEFEEDRKKAIEAGCNYYISKPISKNRLYELIKIFFNK